MRGSGDARFRELVEQAPDAFVLVDEDRVITYVNAFAERLYGWSREELVGHHIDALVPERFRALLAGMDTSAIAPGARLGAGLDLTALRKDGSEFPVEINMMALPGEHGLQVASVVRDVTRRRKMEERLAASEAKFRRVVEGLAGDYFFATLDRDGTVSYVSPSVEAILGYTADELGRDFRGFLTDHAMNERASELLVRGFAGERTRPYDLEVRHKNGSSRILECTDTPVRDESGVVIAVESLNRDVTWLRAAEQEIREAHARTDRLLRSILPDPIVDELAAESRVRPRRHEDVAVLFCDLAGFTAYCDSREPEEVVVGLRHLVNRFEEVTEGHGLQKIKTIGDAFMAAAGLLHPLRSPVEAAVRCGFGLIDAAAEAESPWRLRVGIHVGDVVAGVMGRRQFGYDLWGDTVNTAARMEGFADGERLALSRSAWRKVEGRFPAEPLGPVAVKGKGELEVFLVARSGAS